MKPIGEAKQERREGESGREGEGRDRDREDHHDLFNMWNERKFKHGGQQFNYITPISKSQRNQ